MSSLIHCFGNRVFVLLALILLASCGTSDHKAEAKAKPTLTAPKSLSAENDDLIKETQDRNQITLKVGEGVSSEDAHRVLEILARPSTLINPAVKMVTISHTTFWISTTELPELLVDSRLSEDDLLFSLVALESRRSFEMRRALEAKLEQAKRARPNITINIAYERVEESDARKVLDLLISPSTSVHHFIKVINICEKDAVRDRVVDIQANGADIAYTLKNYQTPAMGVKRYHIRGLLRQMRARRYGVATSVKLDEVSDDDALRVVELLDTPFNFLHPRLTQIIIGAHNELRVDGGKVQLKLDGKMSDEDILFFLKNLFVQSGIVSRPSF